MKHAFILVLVAGTFVTIEPALASSQPEGSASASEDDAGKMVCKREKVIGSRVQKRRICMNRAEWRRLENGTREQVGEFLKRSTGPAPQ